MPGVWNNVAAVSSVLDAVLSSEVQVEKTKDCDKGVPPQGDNV